MLCTADLPWSVPEFHVDVKILGQMGHVAWTAQDSRKPGVLATSRGQKAAKDQPPTLLGTWRSE